MKIFLALCTLLAGIVLSGCASNNPPAGESYPTPPAHHNMGGKLGN